ncbi:methyl-accepting chemotaxis protein [Bradyrhizobium sp. STM 3809]|uniref:methyl-accepting chemotaxis protein n=1 Tax=Bradyrhizobium sp. STM 3809 TaxID=551936 RepID=UPI0002409418|nr:methyl-accepting chemotaxis protein [Bradyrhizobium sp. STM 3809]CCE01948.1 putative methyl-accepting chemotaxis receptor/sensory transducer [Bradyrhizobium sp. STM 3809]
MAGFTFRIGTKLGLTAAIGVALVGGMLGNQLYGDQLIAESSRSVAANYTNKSSAQTAEGAMLRAQLALRGIGTARSAAELDDGLQAFRSSAAAAATEVDATGKRAKRPQVKELYQATKQLIDQYIALGSDLAAGQKAAVDALTASGQAADGWAREMGQLQSSLAAGSPGQGDLQSELRGADTLFNAARAALWQFASGDAAAKAELAQRLDGALAMLKRARAAATDKPLAAGLDQLAGAAERFRSDATRVAVLQDGKSRLLAERLMPMAAEIGEKIAKAVAFGEEFAQERRNELLATLTSVRDVALTVGALVVLVLIGSALFSVLTIARPIRRIGEVLLELAGGNKAVTIPFTERGDEVGDNARAARTFKDNLIRIERMEAEQKNQEAAAAAGRKAEMIKLADAFQNAVGGVVGSVSAASNQLEKAAGTLSGTADDTQKLAGMVAAASEEASTNVGAVASAAEEMSASVAEIGRQVHNSSRIASEAVKQAERTDARINELQAAAGRIGDVVKLITAIAEQTNLLALNATIEAARAGESGRGFAVVASEVKALAAQTAKATEDIGAQIMGMQAATQESVAAIKEIGTTITQISDIAATIAATVEQQGAATREIARNVGEAAKGTAEVAEKITHVNQGASATGAASAQVLTSARSLARESSGLKSEVENFLSTVRAA